MNLVKEIQLKNERLMSQRLVLLQQWSRRLKASGSGFFLGAFILAPFVLGAATPFFLARQGLVIRLWRTILMPSVMSSLLPHVTSLDRP